MRKHRPTGENREGTFGKCPHNKNGKEKGESDGAVCKYTTGKLYSKYLVGKLVCGIEKKYFESKTVLQISCGKVGVRHRKKIFRIEKKRDPSHLFQERD